ncbi:Pr6Pr family membrane protein [Pseudoxanthomonas sp. PXM02]|uniref:Pr6Pr family membrane protein n=1 Tax=Pseudoxanthomonas sp. PXM02 TaxID=2769294 RepID=UPI00177F81A1|nr:Pr6Pr family membrane protein [Pseudoxanthomonas sp. PXM02]MBD9480813.1 Pr6Pr family membrane protein [Pseudoxanthomonas sp. PXM02]
MQRIWNLILAVAIAATVIAQLVLLLAGGADVNTAPSAAPVPLPTRLLRFFSYFTVQSNLLVLAAAITLVIDPQRDGKFWRVLRLDGLLGIAVTGVVSATLLAGLIHPVGIGVWINAGFHQFSPVWTLVGWLLLGPRPRVDMGTIALAFIWPTAWLAYTMVHGALTGWYPYPFLNADKLGYGQVSITLVVILAAALATAFAFHVLERWLPPSRTR